MAAALLSAIGRFDAAAFVLLRQFHTPLLDFLLDELSEVARGGVLWMALGLLFAVIRPSRAPAVVHVFLAIGQAALLATSIMKPLLGRPRPFEVEADLRVVGPRPDSHSFPSGHAATSFAGAYALTRMMPGASLPLWLLASLVAFSRIYLGVHYPLDVIGGALVGLSAAGFVMGGMKWRRTDAEKLKVKSKK
jgi:undecaprenyl-diphosphatase